MLHFKTGFFATFLSADLWLAYVQVAGQMTMVTTPVVLTANRTVKKYLI